MDIGFVTYSREFLEVSLKWLTDPEIKKLTMSPSINVDNQKKWFDTLKDRDDYYIRGIIVDGKPVGAFGFKHIDYNNKTGEYWGYIGEKEYWGIGIGKKMITYACEEAIRIGLDKVYLNVLRDNIRAISLYKKMNFEISEYRDSLIIMTKKLI